MLSALQIYFIVSSIAKMTFYIKTIDNLRNDSGNSFIKFSIQQRT